MCIFCFTLTYIILIISTWIFQFRYSFLHINCWIFNFVFDFVITCLFIIIQIDLFFRTTLNYDIFLYYVGLHSNLTFFVIFRFNYILRTNFVCQNSTGSNRICNVLFYSLRRSGIFKIIHFRIIDFLNLIITFLIQSLFFSVI